MRTEKVLKVGLKRKPGYIYFLDRNLNICRQKSSKTSKNKPKLVLKTELLREDNLVYLIDEEGDISYYLPKNKSDAQ